MVISIAEARKAVQNGGIVVYPTDTVWGMGCDPFNRSAVKKLFEVKGKKEDGLSIMLSDAKMIEDYCEVSQVAGKIISEFLPGPVTLILRSKRNFAMGVARDGNIAVRVPANRTALELAEKQPIVTTSANIHGNEIASSLKEATQIFGFQCSYLDGEEPRGIESTIIDLTKKKPKIKRIGALYSSILEGIIEF